MYSAPSPAFSDPRLNRLLTISSLASSRFSFWQGMKLSSLAWTLKRTFLFLEAFLSTSFFVRSLFLSKYFMVSLIRNYLSPFSTSCS